MTIDRDMLGEGYGPCFDLVLVHSGGTHKTMTVEFVAPAYVSVRWGQSGVYDLRLKTNVLTARSPKARLKSGGAAVPWRALDIREVRALAADWLKARDHKAAEDMRRTMLEHDRTMPGRRR